MLAQRRPDDTNPDELHPGQYARINGKWWLRLPDGTQPKPLDETWTVTEHTDATITVTPSIRCRWTGWHGWLTRGTWREQA